MNEDITERLRKCESLTRGPLYSLAIEAWEEIERLRNRIAQLEQALDALGYLKAINTINTITVELGPKASGPDDIADALRKAVGR